MANVNYFIKDEGQVVLMGKKELKNTETLNARALLFVLGFKEEDLSVQGGDVDVISEDFENLLEAAHMINFMDSFDGLKFENMEVSDHAE